MFGDRQEPSTPSSAVGALDASVPDWAAEPLLVGARRDGEMLGDRAAEGLPAAEPAAQRGVVTECPASSRSLAVSNLMSSTYLAGVVMCWSRHYLLGLAGRRDRDREG